MGIAELFLLAVGLAMDAFAVSVCKGLSLKKPSMRDMIVTGLWFGGFQMLMPCIGYFLSASFYKYIEKIDHWLVFTLLLIIGINMIREAVSPGEDEKENSAALDPKSMFPLAVATSIDALAVGVTFACLKVAVLPASALIGVLTLIISAAGVKIGSVFGTAMKNKAAITGGIILILIGLRVLLQHLGIINF